MKNQTITFILVITVIQNEILNDKLKSLKNQNLKKRMRSKEDP